MQWHFAPPLTREPPRPLRRAALRAGQGLPSTTLGAAGVRVSRAAAGPQSMGATDGSDPRGSDTEPDLLVDVSEANWVAVAAIAGAVTASAVVVTAFIAARTLKATRDDSRARTRPIIVAELRRELLSPGTTLLVLRNLGASVATNVTVAFNPGPPPDVDSLPDTDMWKWIYHRFAKPITTWAPGWTLSNAIRAGHDPLPPVVVTVSYTGPDGTKYHDRYDLHPDHMLKETSSSPSKTHDPVKMEQQKIAALQALVRAISSS